jgi:hypothetical protein
LYGPLHLLGPQCGKEKFPQLDALEAPEQVHRKLLMEHILATELVEPIPQATISLTTVTLKSAQLPSIFPTKLFCCPGEGVDKIGDLHGRSCRGC